MGAPFSTEMQYPVTAPAQATLQTHFNHQPPPHSVKIRLRRKLSREITPRQYWPYPHASIYTSSSSSPRLRDSFPHPQSEEYRLYIALFLHCETLQHKLRYVGQEKGRKWRQAMILCLLLESSAMGTMQLNRNEFNAIRQIVG